MNMWIGKKEKEIAHFSRDTHLFILVVRDLKATIGFTKSDPVHKKG